MDGDVSGFESFSSTTGR